VGGIYEGLDDAGAHGEDVLGPPWILGHRGTPREAPENTLAGLRRAVDVGLDGFEYDLRGCAGGDAVLLHDATLERTTDGEGRLAEHTLPELFRLDAGSWFARRFTGEPLPVFEEALEIAGDRAGGWPRHMIELKEPGLVKRVATKLGELGPGLDVRVASFQRDVVLAARDADLPCMLLAVRADEDDLRFVRDERIDAYAVGPGGWRTPAGRKPWTCERWGWSVDEPDDLLEACRSPLFGFNTNEPYRALATRALVKLTPDDGGPYPVLVPELYVEPERLEESVRLRGEWYGAWSSAAEVRNPFPWPVEVRCGIFLPSGAFEIEGLPAAFDLEVGEQRTVGFRLTGGSRMPGGDPLFAALFTWRVGTGGAELRPGGKLLLDAPLRRRRVVSADPVARRLEMLVERPGDPAASMTLQRRRDELLVSIENPGGLEDAHVIAHLNGELVRGGRGLRLLLPSGFDLRGGGVTFSCGMEGREAGEARVRRWAGGVPEGLMHGAPGLLVPLGQG
jgi:glycerophosphoryl diester phosphodiesterase family protein